MRVAFQEGSELAGQGTSEEHYFEVNYDDTAKEFEIITIFPNDTMQVPGGVLVPKVGDKYILSHLRMPDEYYPLAEKEFLEAVKKFNEENFIDNSVYKADTDHVWVEQQRADLFLGRRIRLLAQESWRRRWSAPTWRTGAMGGTPTLQATSPSTVVFRLSVRACSIV